MFEKEDRTWLVRSGRGGIYAESFLEAEMVAIGWGEVGEIAHSLSDSEIARMFREQWPDAKPRSRASWAAQTKRFLREIQEGDNVVTYDPETRLYHIGKVRGPAELQVRTIDDQKRQEFVRKVSWTSRRSRDDLSLNTRNTLGSIMTIFQVPKGASDELMGSQLSRSTAAPHPEDLSGETDLNDAEELILDYISRSEQLIEDKIASLDWQEMQELVAGILRGMGYRTRVSEPGSDLGVDVFASPDGLGLVEPRIFVEVKHRTKSTGTELIRAFLGGRRQGDRCLYVSIGSFTKDARYEASRSLIPLMLISLPDLRGLFVDHYDSLDSASQSLVPLRKIFLPAPE